MKIKRLVLSDFGKFHQEELLLSPGINIATGANESGKTTLRRFIRSMFYGLERERGIKARKDDYIRFKPWEYGRFQGILEFESEGKTYRLFRNFLTTEKEIRITELETGREISEPTQFLKECGLVSETVYTNTFWIGNSCATEELLAGELKDYLVNLAYGGTNGVNLQKSLSWLAARKKEILRRIPEQELEACLEQSLRRETLQEQRSRIQDTMEVNLRKQKQLEAEISTGRGVLEKVTAERKQAELLAQQKTIGERILFLFSMIAVLVGGAAFFLPLWQWKAAGWGIGVLVLLFGLLQAMGRIKKGKKALAAKEELTTQLEQMSVRLDAMYQELTGLIPAIEQDRFRIEQTEEQLQGCLAAEERYEIWKQKKKELLTEAEAVELAANTLTRLSAELYEEFGAKFANSLSEYAKAFTDHNYEMLTADEALSLRAVTDNRSLEISEVSFGTGEQFYLALRFAAADVFDPEKKNPMILDDSFAAFDDQRLESAILALQRCGRQVLVLSSTGREEAAAKRMGITYEAIF